MATHHQTVQCAHCEECDIMVRLRGNTVQFPEGWVLGLKDDRVALCCSEECAESAGVDVDP